MTRIVFFSHLEKSLLMVPYKFVPDILHALGTCISKYYRVELASRVLMFLIKSFFFCFTGLVIIVFMLLLFVFLAVVPLPEGV